MPSLQDRIIKFFLQFMVPWWRSDLSIQKQRTNLNRFASLSKLLPGVNSEPIYASSVPCEWVLTPKVDPAGVILYFHGGGYVLGSPSTHRELASRLAQAAGIRVLAVDYRLAPEHPFPAALEDGVAVYCWLLDQNIRPGKIIIAGDSAGGGLTLATILKIRDLGLPAPAGGVLISPWVDLAGTGASMQTKLKADIILKHFDPATKAKMYAGDHDLRNPYVSPLYADLANLPPLLIHAGANEILLDDAIRIAEGVNAAGGSATLKIWDEMLHVFHAQAMFLPEAREAIEEIGEFVKNQIKR